MRILMAMLTLGLGLALIGRGDRRISGLLPAPDDQPREPESWLAGETEAFASKH